MQQANNEVAAQVSLAHIEVCVERTLIARLTRFFGQSNLASALLLRSNKEYLDWLSVYVRKLSTLGYIDKLRELLNDFLGPAHRPSWCVTTSQGEWDPMILVPSPY